MTASYAPSAAGAASALPPAITAALALHRTHLHRALQHHRLMDALKHTAAMVGELRVAAGSGHAHPASAAGGASGLAASGNPSQITGGGAAAGQSAAAAAAGQGPSTAAGGLGPTAYYELWMAVTAALADVAEFVYDGVTAVSSAAARDADTDAGRDGGADGAAAVLASPSGTVPPLHELYELVQYAGSLLPRLYLMVTVGSVAMRAASDAAADAGDDLAASLSSAAPSAAASALAPITRLGRKEVMRDMLDMVRGVQHPLRGLFLRYYLVTVTKGHLPTRSTAATKRAPAGAVASSGKPWPEQDGAGNAVVAADHDERELTQAEIDAEHATDDGSLHDTLTFLLTNFIEMNKLWVRHQHAGPWRERAARHRERKELRLLVGVNLVRLSELIVNSDPSAASPASRVPTAPSDGASAPGSPTASEGSKAPSTTPLSPPPPQDGLTLDLYASSVLPLLLHEIVGCRDVLAQTYLLDGVVNVFPDAFHLGTLRPLVRGLAAVLAQYTQSSSSSSSSSSINGHHAVAPAPPGASGSHAAPGASEAIKGLRDVLVALIDRLIGYAERERERRDGSPPLSAGGTTGAVGGLAPSSASRAGGAWWARSMTPLPSALDADAQAEAEAEEDAQSPIPLRVLRVFWDEMVALMMGTAAASSSLSSSSSPSAAAAAAAANDPAGLAEPWSAETQPIYRPQFPLADTLMLLARILKLNMTCFPHHVALMDRVLGFARVCVMRRLHPPAPVATRDSTSDTMFQHHDEGHAGAPPSATVAASAQPPPRLDRDAIQSLYGLLTVPLETYGRDVLATLLRFPSSRVTMAQRARVDADADAPGADPAAAGRHAATAFYGGNYTGLLVLQPPATRRAIALRITESLLGALSPAAAASASAHGLNRQRSMPSAPAVAVDEPAAVHLLLGELLAPLIRAQPPRLAAASRRAAAASEPDGDDSGDDSGDGDLDPETVLDEAHALSRVILLIHSTRDTPAPPAAGDDDPDTSDGLGGIQSRGATGSVHAAHSPPASAPTPAAPAAATAVSVTSPPPPPADDPYSALAAEMDMDFQGGWGSEPAAAAAPPGATPAVPATAVGTTAAAPAAAVGPPVADVKAAEAGRRRAQRRRRRRLRPRRMTARQRLVHDIRLLHIAYTYLTGQPGETEADGLGGSGVALAHGPTRRYPLDALLAPLVTRTLELIYRLQSHRWALPPPDAPVTAAGEPVTNNDSFVRHQTESLFRFAHRVVSTLAESARGDAELATDGFEGYGFDVEAAAVDFWAPSASTRSTTAAMGGGGSGGGGGVDATVAPAEAALRLFLQCALAAATCGFEEATYAFLVEAYVLYEERIGSDSRTQVSALQLIVGTLIGVSGMQRCEVLGADGASAAAVRAMAEKSWSVLGPENRETLVAKAALHATRLLKRADQSRAIALVSHLFWETPVARTIAPGAAAGAIAGTDDAAAASILLTNPQPYHHARRTLECLQKANHVASSGSVLNSALQSALQIEILERYLYFFDSGVETVTLDHINAVLASVARSVARMVREQHQHQHAAGAPSPAPGLAAAASDGFAQSAVSFTDLPEDPSTPAATAARGAASGSHGAAAPPQRYHQACAAVLTHFRNVLAYITMRQREEAAQIAQLQAGAGAAGAEALLGGFRGAAGLDAERGVPAGRWVAIVTPTGEEDAEAEAPRPHWGYASPF
ncbi:hypothetical protein CXG81DRAFT_23691 [Caulochytrium protostelioides]|uniref:Vacuolar protein sorting-associated protein 35 n=1 Tax=Caulochytrium protostelioides TaxID=1555241 RepID=A0A4P9XE01_9FUNG|nr:hypothetical protein CXG81DRAFT_23691 [Caulochytrium protostelioides]|eukprot:RKP03718.1 hypothetical protein CXG81DRAFT_23691 [Caulochytrium protostelioides]